MLSSISLSRSAPLRLSRRYLIHRHRYEKDCTSKINVHFFSKRLHSNYRQQCSNRNFFIRPKRLVYGFVVVLGVNIVSRKVIGSTTFCSDVEHGYKDMSINSFDRNDETFLEMIIDKMSYYLQFLWSILQVSIRGAEISLRCSPLLVLCPLGYLERSMILAMKNEVQNSSSSIGWIEKAAWHYIIYTLNSLGPAFVKLGQWAATRKDLCSDYFGENLSVLHSKCQVHAWADTDKTLRRAFGMNYNERLVISEDNVLGGGCVAQVYKAKLDGKDVAVKVLHPGISKSIERDILLMNRLVCLLDALPFKIIKYLGLARAASNFENILRQQIDLSIECKNLCQFLNNFDSQRSNKRTRVTFPTPVQEFVSREVMVEEFIDGVPISEYLSDNSKTGIETRRQLAKPLLKAFLKMVFIDNFVHCDLHPGNVLVTDKDEKLNIVFLDAGLTESLNIEDRRNLKDLFTAVVFNRGKEAGRLMVERAKFETCSSTDGGVEAFSNGVDEIVQEFHLNRKKGLTLGAVRIGSLLKQVLDLCRIHGVEIDPAMASIVISTLVLEGLGRSLEPNINLFEFVVPMLS